MQSVTARTFVNVRGSAVLLLCLLAFSSLVSYNMVMRRVEAQHRDSQLINVSGRQRVYSQLIPLIAQKLVLATTHDARDGLRIELQQAVLGMVTDYAQLRNPRSALYPPGTAPDDIHELYSGASALNTKIQAFVSAARQLQQAPDAQLTTRNPDYQTLIDSTEGSLLADLDAVVTIQSLHVQQRLGQLTRVALLSLILTLITLVLVGAGVLFPLLRRQDRALDALERERNFARQLMDNMGQGLGLIGPDFRYSYVNSAYAGMVGRTPEELVGKSPPDIIDPAEHELLNATRAERSAGRTTRQTHHYLHADGRRIQALAVVVPHQMRTGVAGIAVVTDLTERIQAEQQLRQRDLLYRTMATNFPDGALLLFDHALRYTLADGSGLKDVGLRSDMMEGRTPAEVFPAWMAAQLEPDYRAAIRGEASEREIHVGRRTYHMRTLPLMPSAGEDGDPAAQTGAPGEAYGGISIVQDITRQRQAEHDLIRAGAYTKALLEVSQLVQSELAPDEVALKVARIVGSVSDIDWGGLVTLNGETMRTVTAWHSAASDEDLNSFVNLMRSGMRRGQGIIRTVFQDEQARFIDDYPAQPGAHLPYVEAGVRSAAFLPLTRVGDDQFMLLAIRRGQARPWTTEDQALFGASARTVQLSLERRNHILEMESAALLDALTGLGNRRAFERDLARELERSKRSSEGVGILMVDLDGLKQVNDQEGHERGDALLVAFAHHLSTSLRAEDRLYRLGGDEYAAILVRATPAARTPIETRVRRAVDQTRLAGFQQVDASAGMSFSPEDVRDAAELLKLADERMYVQKQEHRQARKAAQAENRV